MHLFLSSELPIHAANHIISFAFFRAFFVEYPYISQRFLYFGAAMGFRSDKCRAAFWKNGPQQSQHLRKAPSAIKTAKSGGKCLRFSPFYESVKERDLIATPSLTADGIFGLPLLDNLPGGQWAAMVTFERMAFPFGSAEIVSLN